MTSEDDISADEDVVADLKFRNNVVGGPTSTPLKIAGLTVNIAGDIAVSVSSPSYLVGDVTVGVVSSPDLAGNVTVGVASPAHPASVVTAGVAFREKCRDSSVVPSGSVCGFDEIAEVAPWADPASVVTGGVAFRESVSTLRWHSRT